MPSPVVATQAANTAPVVTIDTPADATSVEVNSLVTFSGSANDNEDGDISSELGWNSSLDGLLGQGATILSNALSVGTHLITASVADNGTPTGIPMIGNASISVIVTVTPVNSAPVVDISAPSSGSSFVEGAQIAFNGSATDVEDGALTSSIRWTSDIDGLLGTGNPVSSSALSVGTHTISASVTDSGDPNGVPLTGVDNVVLSIVSSGNGTPFALDVQVSSASDDAEEINTGAISLNSTDLDVSTNHVGIRFNGIQVPQEATISKAYIQFTADEARSGATGIITIRGEAADNASTFTSAANNISARSTTAASVNWTPDPWTAIGDAGPAQQTSDIATIIQEIVNRPGWGSGNSAVIIVSPGTGTPRAAETFNANAAAAPILHIEYSTP